MFRPVFYAVALIVALSAIFVGTARLGAQLERPSVAVTESVR